MSPEIKSSAPTAKVSAPHTGLVLVFILVALVLGCVLSLIAVNWYTTTSPQAGIAVNVCAGVSLSPKVQIGLSWQSLLSSYASPLAFSPLAVCINVPHAWLSPTQTRHSWEFLWPP